jgi:GAF domain-containing protein
VENHPKQETIQTYCGVPLINREGEMIGSACHFDFNPGRITDTDVELLEYLAILLQSEY